MQIIPILNSLNKVWTFWFIKVLFLDFETIFTENAEK